MSFIRTTSGRKVLNKSTHTTLSDNQLPSLSCHARAQTQSRRLLRFILASSATHPPPPPGGKKSLPLPVKSVGQPPQPHDSLGVRLLLRGCQGRGHAERGVSSAAMHVRGPLVLLLTRHLESTRLRHEKGLGPRHHSQEQGRSEQRVHVLTHHPVVCVVV